MNRRLATIVITHQPAPLRTLLSVSGTPLPDADPLTDHHRQRLPPELHDAEWVASRPDPFTGLTDVLITHPSLPYVPHGVRPPVLARFLPDATPSERDPAVALAYASGRYWLLMAKDERGTGPMHGPLALLHAHLEESFRDMEPSVAALLSAATLVRAAPCPSPRELIGDASGVGPHLAATGLNTPVLLLTEHEAAAAHYRAGRPVYPVTDDQLREALARSQDDLPAPGDAQEDAQEDAPDA